MVGDATVCVTTTTEMSVGSIYMQYIYSLLFQLDANSCHSTEKESICDGSQNTTQQASIELH